MHEIVILSWCTLFAEKILSRELLVHRYETLHVICLILSSCFEVVCSLSLCWLLYCLYCTRS